MKVLIASKNPVKINACKMAFADMYPDKEVDIVGYSVDSEVSDQPLTSAETLLGAENRVKKLRQNHAVADFFVGIEGGVELHDQHTMAFAWVVVSDGQLTGKACTAMFQLPDKVTHLLKQGLELGDANDQIFAQHNSKQKNGAIGLLTHDLISRTDIYRPAVVMAMIPLMNSIYSEKRE